MTHLPGSSDVDTLPLGVTARRVGRQRSRNAEKAEQGTSQSEPDGEGTSVGIKTVVQHRDRLIRAGLVYEREHRLAMATVATRWG